MHPQRNTTVVSRHPLRFLLLLTLILSVSGCRSYYTTDRYEGRSAIEGLNRTIEEGRYFIFVSGERRFYAQDLQLTDSTLQLIALEIPPAVEQMHARIESRRGRRYRSDEKSIVREVRLHLRPEAELEPGPASVPLSDLQLVEVYDADTGATVASHVLGITAGVALTLVVLTAIVIATKDCCPFAYIGDGVHFTLAGEVYGGAISPPLERSDFLPLPGLEASNGFYHVRIANELLEQQYINVARLVSVTHPEGVRVVLDREGRPRTVHHARSAAQATSSGGADYTWRLQNVDDERFAFDEGEEDVSSVVLRFERPEATSQGRLVVHARVSHWLDYVFDRYTEQFGYLYPRWADRIASRPPEQLRQWMLDQSLPLKVYLREEDGWRFVTHFDMVGPLVGAREMVAPIDLSSVTSDTILIKLETGFSFWEMDAAAMDFSPNGEVDVAHLKFQATTLGGRDVSRALADDDDLYFEQFDIGTAVELRATAVVPAAGSEVSLFLHAKGYYVPIRYYTGVPDLKTVWSFQQPGRFTAFARDHYDAFTSGIKPYSPEPAPVAAVATVP